jgi:antitoxin YefM
MFSSYKLNTSELTPNFIAVIQNAYPNKEVEIVIQDIPPDETAYLLSDSANRDHLLRAIADIQKGENLVSIDPPLSERS